MRRCLRAALMFLFLVTLAIIPVITEVTHAQDGSTLSYGSKVFGRILADTPVVMYSFSGGTGDLVQITIRNWAGAINPHLDLVAPDGQMAGRSATSPYGDDDLEATLGLFLPQSGIYILLVSAESGTTGEYALELQGRGVVSTLSLVYGQSETVTLAGDVEPQYYAFEAVDCPTVFLIQNPSAGQPFTFPFMVKLRDEQGMLIAVLRGGDALEDRVILTPRSGRYEATVYPDDPDQTGAITLLVTCQDQMPGCQSSGQSGVCDPNGVPLSCFEEGPCETFVVTATLEEDGVVAFTWPPVEGAQWYIFSVIDVSGVMLADSPIILEGETSHSYRVTPEDMARGPFTAIVHAGGEADGEEIRCIENVPFSVDERGSERCISLDVRVDVVPGVERMGVASWSAAPGAGAYLVHVYAYGDDGGLIGIRVLTVPGSATTYHLAGVFPSDYQRFQIRVAAYAEPSGGGAWGDMPTGFLCSGNADVEFDRVVGVSHIGWIGDEGGER